MSDGGFFRLMACSHCGVIDIDTKSAVLHLRKDHPKEFQEFVNRLNDEELAALNKDFCWDCKRERF